MIVIERESGCKESSKLELLLNKRLDDGSENTFKDSGGADSRFPIDVKGRQRKNKATFRQQTLGY
jgi:hypothetical protein